MAAEVQGWHCAQVRAVWAQGRGGSCPGPVRHTSHCSPRQAGDTSDLQGKGTPSSFHPVLLLGRFLTLSTGLESGSI